MNDGHLHPSESPWPDASEILQEDLARYEKVVSIELSEEQKSRIMNPERVFPQEQAILAVHWHPEMVPMEWAIARVDAMFPNATEKLVIPTQHNQVMSHNGLCGMEIDCFSREFGLKVQLLIHFSESRREKAGTLQAMTEYTFRYRASQLDQFLRFLYRPEHLDARQEASRNSTALDDSEMRFVENHAEKLARILAERREITPPLMVRNKLVLEWFQSFEDTWHPAFIRRVIPFLKAVKAQVKETFSPDHFFRTQEVIEEARSLGAGIIVPHPEQFWPILLADYDIDGYEVWNPQSQAYTNFLMGAVHNLNRTGRHRDRPLLTLMGDDCHMGEKLKSPHMQDPEKGSREVGLQPAWEDMNIRKTLALYNVRKSELITEYRQRIE